RAVRELGEDGRAQCRSYDAADRVVLTQPPSETTRGLCDAGSFEVLSYDADGNLSAVRRKAGAVLDVTKSQSFDGLSRRTGLVIAASTPQQWSWQYDANGRVTRTLSPGHFAGSTCDVSA